MVGGIPAKLKNMSNSKKAHHGFCFPKPERSVIWSSSLPWLLKWIINPNDARVISTYTAMYIKADAMPVIVPVAKPKNIKPT